MSVESRDLRRVQGGVCVLVWEFARGNHEVGFLFLINDHETLRAWLKSIPSFLKTRNAVGCSFAKM